MRPEPSHLFELRGCANEADPATVPHTPGESCVAASLQAADISDCPPGETAAYRRRLRREKIRQRRGTCRQGDARPNSDTRHDVGGLEDREGEGIDAGNTGPSHSEDVLDKVLADVFRQSGHHTHATTAANAAVSVKEEPVAEPLAGDVSGDVAGGAADGTTDGAEVESGELRGARGEALRVTAAAAAQERKHARVIRNREVALKARQAFKAKLQSLEAENGSLKQKANSLHAENDTLRDQITALRSCFRAHGPLPAPPTK